MKILRRPKELGRPGYGGVYEIELTEKEILDAYEIQNWKYHAQDIAQNVSDRIEDAGKENDYAEDWCIRVGKANAGALQPMMDDNDRYMEMYRDMVDKIVERCLLAHGINPDTMEKANN